MASKPNVLLVVPRLNIGGAETYVYTLATGLKNRGYHVVTASWGGILAEALIKKGIPHYRIPIRLNPYIASLMLERVVKLEKIDIIHANSADAATASFEVCNRMQLPWVMTAHGGFGREVRYRGIQSADRIICVSDFLKTALELGTDIEKKKFVTIYNGVNLAEYTPRGYRETLRHEWGLAKDDFVIGIVARITNTYGKGHAPLLNILAKYPNAKKWKLVIVGKGKYHTMLQLKYMALKLGVADRVVFAGHRTDVAAAIEAMDVVALPSQWETFGLVLAEGMAMRKPVVAYDYAGMAEAIDDGFTGFLAPKDDMMMLAEKIDLCQDEALAEEIGRNGRQRVERMFSMEIMLDKVTALYQEVLCK